MIKSAIASRYRCLLYGRSRKIESNWNIVHFLMKMLSLDVLENQNVLVSDCKGKEQNRTIEGKRTLLSLLSMSVRETSWPQRRLMAAMTITSVRLWSDVMVKLYRILYSCDNWEATSSFPLLFYSIGAFKPWRKDTVMSTLTSFNYKRFEFTPWVDQFKTICLPSYNSIKN